MPSAVCDARPPTFLGPSAGTDTSGHPVGRAGVAGQRATADS